MLASWAVHASVAQTPPGAQAAWTTPAVVRRTVVLSAAAEEHAPVASASVMRGKIKMR